jgi:hypothetical protein
MEFCDVLNNGQSNKLDRTDNIIYSTTDYNNDTRTYNDRIDRIDSCDESKSVDITDENTEQKLDNIDVNIYRYKFTDEFTYELFKFAKIHQYDDRKAFKEGWNLWIETNDEIINQECKRLKDMKYEGDVLDKMFKSARYYFRKKSTEKKEPVQRRTYVCSQKELLGAIDQHIRLNILSGEFKPSDGFEEFCKENVDILKEQISMLCRAGLKSSSEIEAKIKKTYKNRYFLIINK